MKQLPGNIPVVLTGIPHSDNVVYSTILFINYELNCMNIILQLFRFQNISAEVQIGIFSHNKVTKILAMKDPTPGKQNNPLLKIFGSTAHINLFYYHWILYCAPFLFSLNLVSVAASLT